jgi:carbon monoxide dehydrogenase subunit G
MTTYHFVTNWFFEAPIDRVWAVLSDFEAWPQWWSSYRVIETLSAEKKPHVGLRAKCVAKGKLPYSLRFTTEITRLNVPTDMEIKSSGELVGSGRFKLEQKESGTSVTYFWDVSTSNPVLNMFSKLSFARKMMEDNHDYVMDIGYAGLKQRLAAQPN